MVLSFQVHGKTVFNTFSMCSVMLIYNNITVNIYWVYKVLNWVCFIRSYFSIIDKTINISPSYMYNMLRATVPASTVVIRELNFWSGHK